MQEVWVNFEFCTGRRHAHNHSGAATLGRCQGLVDGICRTNDLKRIISHLPPRNVFDPFQNVFTGSVHHVCSAKLQSVLQFISVDIHGDYCLGPGQHCALNHVQTHAACANDHHAAAWFNLGSVDDRPHAGGNAATDQGHAIQRSVFAYLHQAVFRHNGILTKG